MHPPKTVTIMTGSHETAKSRLRMISVAALAAVLLTAAPAVAAASTLPGPAGHGTAPRQAVPAYVASMLAADAVADRLDAAVAGSHLVGFAGLVVLPSQRGLDVYWHGRPPATVTGLAGPARATNVTMRFLPAPYSQAQLDTFRNQILDSPGFASSGITKIIIYPQATGLSIGVAQGIAKARQLPALAASRIPVRFFTAEPAPLDLTVPASSLPGRWADTPPFWGGDAIKSTYAGVGTYICSTGFGVHFANNRRRFFMLTAGHCMVYRQHFTQVFRIANNNKAVGTTFFLMENYDAVTLDTATGVRGAGGGRQIYLGNTSMTSSRGQRSELVAGDATPHTGDLVSTSGAFSGQRSSIQVTSTDVVWTGSTVDGFPERVFGVEAIKRNGSNAAGKGDSGGPVFMIGRHGVIALGLISRGAGHRTACTGIVVSGGRPRICYSGLDFPMIRQILAEGNLALNT
jgi:hypothetical protein